MITKHLFGLIECYSEVGDCMIDGFSFNPIWLFLIYPLIGIVICFLIFYLYSRFIYAK